MSVDPGAGWRLLEVPERIEAGDQYLDDLDGWKRVRVSTCGVVWSPYLRPHRRRVPAATADDTVLHRDVPDAIHRLNGLVAGMAERLAELERKHNSDAPAAEPSDDAVALGRALCDLRDTRESLAAAHRGIDRITAERRAASRERDEARAEKAADWKAACDSALAASKEIGRLKARVAELEAAAPRGWLTDEDHRAVAFAAKAMRGHTITGNLKEIADQLDALLDRPTTPTSEAGTVRVRMTCLAVISKDGRLLDYDQRDGNEYTGTAFIDLTPSQIDLTPAQVRDIERQVSGEVGRG